ncbi:MAG: hypothetical protein ACD_57C00082G0003 [uncultured bacterium]|nr:MAG: hypothetical protein ACD_57C00082G0003 [uncultured bacterium]
MDMNINERNSTIPAWLSEDLLKRVRVLYEPRYKRHLTQREVITIALNLTNLIEHFLKFKRRIDGI